MKFAEQLELVEELLFYGVPMSCLYVDPTNNQHWLAALADVNEGAAIWHMVAVAPENVPRVLSNDLATAMTLLKAMTVSPALYIIKANTFDYSSVLEGERISAVDNQYMPSPESYFRDEVYKGALNSTS